MHVVVTGATGNVGTSVLKALGKLPEIETITGVARRTPKRGFAKTTFVAADVSRDDLTEVFEDASAVVHLAWAFQPTHDVDELERINVDGSRRVFQTAALMGVPAIVHLSSIGAYAPRSGSQLVDESWPTTGVPSSSYSRHKVEAERMLDEMRGMRIVKLRPALIFKRHAAAHVHRLLMGPLVPRVAFDRLVLRLVPTPAELGMQCVHTDDVAEAVVQAVVRDVQGAFNLAADPLLGPEVLRQCLGSTGPTIGRKMLRRLVDITWKLRLQPTDPGWIDLAYESPFIDASRARRELDWTPRHSAYAALEEFLEGLRRGDGLDTPALAPRRIGARSAASQTLDVPQMHVIR
jgi:UDP-glucose 4-epimerase